MSLIEERTYSANGDMVKRLREISAAADRGDRPVISRALFDELTPNDRMAFVKAGGLVRNELARTSFNALDPVGRRQFVESGGVVTD